MIQTYREIIEAMYTDRVDVYRMVKTLLPNKETRLERQLVHEQVACLLSQKSLASNTQTETFNSIRYEVKLFTFPTLDIKQGDELHVTRQGLMHEYMAGEPFRYSSHQEINIMRKEYA